MFEGVKDNYVLTETVGQNAGRTRKPEGGKIFPRSQATPGRQHTEDDVTPDGREPESASYSLFPEFGRFKNCGPLTLRTLVIRILENQYTASRIDDGDMETVAMDGITPKNAKELVANNGHWTPDQTAERIISFSLTIFRNDPKKSDAIKETIIEGFQLAKETFGGELPQAANETFAAVMDRLEAWVINPEST